MKRSVACSLLAAAVLILGVASAKASVMDLVEEHARKLQEGGSEAYLALWKTHDNEYFPEKIDWAGVISACKAVGRYERRFFNFIVRSTFHDSLAIDPKNIHGGADASLFLKDELMRPENKGFSAAALRAIAAVASIYESSMADTLAVCGAVAVEELSRGRAIIIGKNGELNFPVGRLDSTRPAEKHQLPAKDVNVDKFGDFWVKRGFTVQEGVALMGSHALIDDQGCTRSANYNDLCDSTTHSCADEVRMFKWDSHFYQDACQSKIQFHKNGGENAQGRPGTEEEYQNERKHIMCAYTSQEFQQHQLASLAEKKACGKFVATPAEITWEPKCYNTGRKLSGLIHAPNEWPYTKNDAHLAQACQGKNHKRHAAEVQAAMNAYQDEAVWDAHFTPAYIKMVSKYNNMKTKESGAHYHINGLECPSGYQSGRCSTSLADDQVLQPEREYFPFDGPHPDGL